MKISGRNRIRGKVVRVTPGTVNSEVEMKTSAGDTVVGIITKHSQEEMGIKTGDDLVALVKATAVMFIKE